MDDQLRGIRAIIATVALVAAVMQLVQLWPALPRNAPIIDGGLVAVYLVAYAAFFSVAFGLVWVILARLIPPLAALNGAIGRALGPVGGWLMAGGALVVLIALPAARATSAAESMEAEAVALKPSWGPSPYRVKLIGMDGADLDLIDALIAEGDLPNFKRLLDGGAAGPMKTISPHSPVVWTTMATGQPETQHGVTGYTSAYLKGTGIAVPLHPADFLGRWLDGLTGYVVEGAVSSNERRIKAAWEIFSQFGLPSLVVNWWATFPAEAIKGIMVSNHLVPWTGFQSDVLAEHAHAQGLVNPPELTAELVEMLTAFVAERGLEDVERNAFTVAGYQYYKARDDLVFQVYDRLLAPEHAFSTVYVQGIDTASHAYTTLNFGGNINKKRRPRLARGEAEAKYGELIVGAYQRMDARLGAFLDALGPDDCLIVVSDHGWEYDGTSHWNKPDGVFLATGGPFQKGVRINAHVYDVLPTIAHLLGLPISQELSGALVQGALEPGWLAAHPPGFVETYGPRGGRITVEAQEDDEAHLERLRSLGYVE